MSHNHAMNITKGVVAGLVIGGTVGMAVAGTIRPKKSKMRKNAGRALDAVGAIIQSAADFTMH